LSFGIVSAYFIVYEAYFVVGEFCRAIWDVNVILLFRISLGMSGH
jgi:hypothetical protein